MKIFIVCDLSFGDSGKGTVTDALVRSSDAKLIVRYNGGCQASHSVYSPTGVQHSFSQFGSTFVPDVYTFLSRYMLVNPLTLQAEAGELADKGLNRAIDRVLIDGRARVVTPYHRAVNRLKELSRMRYGKRHGSCGMGIGETVADSLHHPELALRMQDFHDVAVFHKKLTLLKERMRQEVDALASLPREAEVTKQLSTFDFPMDQLMERYWKFYDGFGQHIIDEYAVSVLLHANEKIVFEGAQGVLLDENYGFYPHNTWSNTTPRNARLILEEAEIVGKPLTIGLIRSYTTRHGEGPFPTEDKAMSRQLADPNNPHNAWQGSLRSGPLDMALLEYAMKASGPLDCLAITHMDKVTEPWPVCTSYKEGPIPFPASPGQAAQMQEQTGKRLETVHPNLLHFKKQEFLEVLGEHIAPIGLLSYGPGPDDKEFCGVLKEVLTDKE